MGLTQLFLFAQNEIEYGRTSKIKGFWILAHSE